jgi:hypothetical protein
MCRHHLHAKAAGADRNRRVLDQVREHTTVEAQGRRDSAHCLSPEQYRHEWSRLTEAGDSEGAQRFAQHSGDVDYPFAQPLPFGAADDLDGLQDGCALRR